MDEDESYGNISLGRSFALEMAALIPQSDLRLGMRWSEFCQICSLMFYYPKGTINKYGVDNIDFASDFIAQYTARQEYKFSGISVNSKRTSKLHCMNLSALAN